MTWVNAAPHKFRMMKSQFEIAENEMLDQAEWKPEYNVGDEMLDAQHRKLLQLCKRVSQYVCDGSKASIEAFHSILSELAFYADKHFELEEDILRRVSFPGLEEQLSEHNAYREWLLDYLFLAMNGEIDKVPLQSYLEAWWIKHILVSDMQYKNFLLQQA